MYHLWIKDFKFTRKYLCIAMVYSLLVPPILILDGDAKFYFAAFFIPYLSVSITLGKICMIEDTTNMRCILKLLPYKTYIKVAARFLFVITLLFTFMSYLTVVQYHIFHLGELKELIINNSMLFFVYMCYFSLYLALYYCFGNQAAQYSVYACIVIVFILALLFERMGLTFDFEILTKINYYVVFSLLGVGIIFLMFILSSIGSSKRSLI